MSLYSLSSAGQTGQNEVSEGENSDSGDSLFITQANVPEAVRTQRRKSHTLISDVTSGEDPDSIWSIADDEERKEERERLPRYSFTFLSEKGQRRNALSAQQNKKLHYTLMKGYFKCVGELWESYRRGEDLVASQPTIDTVGVHITPISEEEDEVLEDNDIKVVEKKHFVVPSKAKRPKPWCGPDGTVFTVRQQTTRSSVAGFEAKRCQRTRVEKNSRWKPSLKMAVSSEGNLSNDGNSSDGVLQEGETGDECAQPGPQNTERALKRAKRKIFDEEELRSNSGAPVYECRAKKSVKAAVALQPQSYVGIGEHDSESQHLLQWEDDTANSDTRKKKKKKHKGDHKGVEEGRDQSPEEVKGQRAEASASVGTTDVESSLSQATEEPEPKKRKKKGKRNKSVPEDIREAVDGHAGERVEEDSVINVDKKRKREELNTDTLAEYLTDKCELKQKKKKHLNETLDFPHISADCLESAVVSQKTLEFSRVKRKKHKKSKKLSALNDRHVKTAACADLDFNDDGTNLSRLSVKKKSESEASVDVSYTPEGEENADDAQKTETLDEQDAAVVTKKKKKKENVSKNLAEVTETPSDYSVSARKKEKKKTSSFLVADEEEKAARSQSAGARDSDAEKRGVSEGCVAARAAQITGSLEEPEKNKSAAEENEERRAECEEAKDTGWRVSSKTGVRKRKKEHKRDKSELVSSTDRSEGAAQTDEDVVMKKKKKKKSKDVAEASAEEKSALSVSVSHSSTKKSKHGDGSKISAVSSFCHDKEARKSQVQEASPVNKPSANKKTDKAANHRLDVTTSINAEVETRHKSTEQEREEPTADGRLSFSSSETQPETSSSHRIRKSSHMKGKRRLHNLNEDFV